MLYRIQMIAGGISRSMIVHASSTLEAMELASHQNIHRHGGFTITSWDIAAYDTCVLDTTDGYSFNEANHDDLKTRTRIDQREDGTEVIREHIVQRDGPFKGGRS